MIRIIGGKYRSRNIDTPNVITTQPTKDMVRGAIFSSLGDDVISKTVLDLFAGSGALGLEALSRGANKAYFVDNNLDAYNIIKKNISLLNEEHAFAMHLDYEEALQDLKEKNIAFDIVFLDPPYKDNVYKHVINIMQRDSLLAKNAIIIIESDHHIVFDELDYKKIKEYKYGKTLIYILRR